MNKLFLPVAFLLCLLPVVSFASGHNPGLEYLPLVFAIFGAVLLVAILNIISVVVALSSSSKFSIGLLWVCLISNFILLFYALSLLISRIQEHQEYQHYGSDVDSEGFMSYSSKALVFIVLLCLGIAFDIVFIRRSRQGNTIRNIDAAGAESPTWRYDTSLNNELNAGVYLVVATIVLNYCLAFIHLYPFIPIALSYACLLACFVILNRHLSLNYRMNVHLSTRLIILSLSVALLMAVVNLAARLEGHIATLFMSFIRAEIMLHWITCVIALVGYVLLGKELLRCKDTPALQNLGKSYLYLMPFIYLVQILSSAFRGYLPGAGSSPTLLFFITLANIPVLLMAIAFYRAARYVPDNNVEDDV